MGLFGLSLVTTEELKILRRSSKIARGLSVVFGMERPRYSF